MRDLDLLEQYLVRLRQEKLQLGHQAALKAESTKDFIQIANYAHEAELVERIRAELKVLAHEPGEFIKRNLT